MKVKFKKYIFWLIINLKLENMLFSLGRKMPLLKKAIPDPEYYCINSLKFIKRSNVCYDVDMSDFMQWHLFVDLPDYSWKHAINYIRDNSTILDIGSNVGNFSIKLAQKIFEDGKKANVIAFEPNQFIYKKLTRNVELNPQIKEFIVSENMALGNENALKNFTFSNTNTGGGKITDGNSGFQVQVLRLDDYFFEQDFAPISFIKIDVEGYEYEVLLGSAITIKKYRPVLYIEITEMWLKANGASSSHIYNFLKRNKYDLFVDSVGSLHPLNEQTDLPWQFNILALPAGQV